MKIKGDTYEKENRKKICKNYINPKKQIMVIDFGCFYVGWNYWIHNTLFSCSLEWVLCDLF